MNGLMDMLFILTLLELLTLTHDSLIDKLAKYGLDIRKVRWIENSQNCWAQRVVIRGVKSSLKVFTSGVLRGQCWVNIA